MLKFIVLHAANPDAHALTLIGELGQVASAAGFELHATAQLARQGEADGLIVLLSGDQQAALAAQLKGAERLYRNTAVTLVRLADGQGREAPVQDITQQLLQAAACFIYPYGLSQLDKAQPSASLKAWLAGYSKFTAAVKMWRALEGVSIDAAALAHQQPQLNHINILARDLELSQAFYRDIFGARYCYNLGPRKVVMELNGFDFFIEQSAEFSYPPGYHIGIRALPEDVKRIAERVVATGTIKLVKGNGPAPGYHHGPDNVRSAVYFEDPDGLVVEVYSAEIEMIETNRRLLLDQL
ncbi:VOC family protein [Pseudomonas tructae]|uniref:VOC family protein n=1 Tax=Pseudomonas tructae TaxID=2518644 RepID=A0A411MKK8_9PSED|nr:VOC family protein [Pseudomonas tructae]QBF27333.1 VOC family protein [Pseudomonas tructae]